MLSPSQHVSLPSEASEGRAVGLRRENRDVRVKANGQVSYLIVGPGFSAPIQKRAGEAFSLLIIFPGQGFRLVWKAGMVWIICRWKEVRETSAGAAGLLLVLFHIRLFPFPQWYTQARHPRETSRPIHVVVLSKGKTERLNDHRHSWAQ